MDTQQIIFVIFVSLLATIAGSYGWAMRGTVLGGERGAMLPGALLGMIFAFASGSEVLSSSFWILTTVGASAMGFGGSQTYGETIDMTARRQEKALRQKGRIGLFIRGANWFAIFGGMIGIGVASMAGKYKAWELCLLIALIPIVKMLGILCLNSPQKPAEGKFPPLYFSYKRFECWGGIAFIWLELVIFALIKKDYFTVAMVIAGLIGGGFGFFIGNLFQTGSSGPFKNGKYLFGKLQKSGFVASWTTMEFTLGAMGGLATALCFCLALPKTGYVELIDSGKGFNPILNIGYNGNVIFTYVWLALLLVHLGIYAFGKDAAKIVGIKMKAWGKKITSQEATAQLTEVRENPSAFANKMENLSDRTMQLTYMLAPLLLMFFGNGMLARITSMAIIYCVLAEEILFSFRKKLKHHKLVGALMFAAIAVVIILQLTRVFVNSAFVTWIFCIFVYEITELILLFKNANIKELKKTEGSLGKAILSLKQKLTVRVFSLFEIAILIVMGYFFFPKF